MYLDKYKFKLEISTLENTYQKPYFGMEASKNTIKLKFYLYCGNKYAPGLVFQRNQKIFQDGSVILIFESDINMILTGWIRGFGSEVEVIESEELRTEIIADLRKNLGRYK